MLVPVVLNFEVWKSWFWLRLWWRKLLPWPLTKPLLHLIHGTNGNWIRSASFCTVCAAPSTFLADGAPRCSSSIGLQVGPGWCRYTSKDSQSPHLHRVCNTLWNFSINRFCIISENKCCKAARKRFINVDKKMVCPNHSSRRIWIFAGPNHFNVRNTGLV